jgi:hypothetical protein
VLTYKSTSDDLPDPSSVIFLIGKSVTLSDSNHVRLSCGLGGYFAASTETGVSALGEELHTVYGVPVGGTKAMGSALTSSRGTARQRFLSFWERNYLGLVA